MGRYHGSNLGPWATVLGTLVFSLGWILITWAMVVNTHFEVTVRIQTDRNHKVVTSGPLRSYPPPRLRRAGLWALGSPLVIGSAYGLIPAGPDDLSWSFAPVAKIAPSKPNSPATPTTPKKGQIPPSARDLVSQTELMGE